MGIYFQLRLISSLLHSCPSRSKNYIYNAVTKLRTLLIFSDFAIFSMIFNWWIFTVFQHTAWLSVCMSVSVWFSFCFKGVVFFWGGMHPIIFDSCKSCCPTRLCGPTTGCSLTSGTWCWSRSGLEELYLCEHRFVTKAWEHCAQDASIPPVTTILALSGIHANKSDSACTFRYKCNVWFVAWRMKAFSSYYFFLISGRGSGRRWLWFTDKMDLSPSCSWTVTSAGHRSSVQAVVWG